MKIAVAALSAALLVSAFSLLAHAQVQLTIPGAGVTVGQPAPQPGYGQAPPPAYGQNPGGSQYADQRERCDRLEARSRELHGSLDRTPPGPDRVSLDQRLRATNQEQQQCAVH